jgi:peptide/nickel transport system permease protein
LRLLLIGSPLGAVIGVLLGVWGAVRQYRASDQIVTYASFVVIATPTFVIGVLLMILATQFNNLVGSQVITFTGEYTAGISGSWWDLALDRAVHLLCRRSRSR